jgi:hypothetical protein
MPSWYIFGVLSGFGLAYTVSKSKREETDNHITTVFRHSVAGYDAGWKFRRDIRKHDYNLSVFVNPIPRASDHDD